MAELSAFEAAQLAKQERAAANMRASEEPIVRQVIGIYPPSSTKGIAATSSNTKPTSSSSSIDRSAEINLEKLYQHKTFAYEQLVIDGTPHVILELPADAGMYITGTVNIKVLVGAVNVMGYTINAATLFHSETKVETLDDLQYTLDQPQIGHWWTIYSSKKHISLNLRAVSGPTPIRDMTTPDKVEAYFANTPADTKHKLLIRKLKERMVSPTYPDGAILLLREYSGHPNIKLAKSGNEVDIHEHMTPMNTAQTCLPTAMKSCKFILGSDGETAELAGGHHVYQYTREMAAFCRQVVSEAAGLSFSARHQSHLSASARDSHYSVMVTGNANSGKSTFAKHLCNQLLTKFPLVAYLETDISQPEFCIPGTVSLTILEAPILGPSLCHQRRPLSTYFVGEMTPVYNKSFHMKAIHKLYLEYTEVNRDMLHSGMGVLPLVINTCGWALGEGLNLLRVLTNTLDPRVIVQIDASAKRDLFLPNESPPEADVHAISSAVLQDELYFSNANTRGGDQGEAQTTLVKRLRYDFYRFILELTQPGELKSRRQNSAQTQASKIARELIRFPLDLLMNVSNLLQMSIVPNKAMLGSQISAIKSGYEHDAGQLFKHYVLPLSHFAVSMSHSALKNTSALPPHHYLSILDRSFVALCEVDTSSTAASEPLCCEKGPILRMLREEVLAPVRGFAFVAAINASDEPDALGHAQVIYLTTNLSISDLQSVNCLVKGNLAAPNEYLAAFSSSIQSLCSELSPFYLNKRSKGWSPETTDSQSKVVFGAESRPKPRILKRNLK